jgi:hypothetical protein
MPPIRDRLNFAVRLAMVVPRRPEDAGRGLKYLLEAAGLGIFMMLGKKQKVAFTTFSE